MTKEHDDHSHQDFSKEHDDELALEPEAQPDEPEAGADLEAEPTSVESKLIRLAARLGFSEPDELRKLRENITAEMPEDSSFKLIADYQNMARALTPGESDPPGSNIVLAVNIAGVAAILRSGRTEDAYEAIDEIIMAAEQGQDFKLADDLADLQRYIQ